MEMTIAEPIQTLEYLKNIGIFPFSTIDGVLYTEESIDVAIETMRKYQKIKEQVDIAIDKENFAISDARLIQIREFIDGNDD